MSGRGAAFRPLGGPRPVRVEAAPDGTPLRVALGARARRVTSVRDDWLVQDRWWTDRPVDRRYFEVVLEPGRVALIYREPDGAWLAHG